jgi:adenylate cyclase
MNLPDALAEAHSLARKAVALDPAGAAGYVSLARGRFWQGDHEGALTAARRALATNPNDSTAFHLVGMALLFSGRPQKALDPIRKAIRLNPHDPGQANRFPQIAIAYYFLRDYDAAIAAAKEALHLYPDHPWTYRWLAAALGQAGHLDEARVALRHAITLAPKSFDIYVRQRVPWMRVEDYEHMLEGLRKAGWEG